MDAIQLQPRDGRTREWREGDTEVPCDTVSTYGSLGAPLRNVRRFHLCGRRASDQDVTGTRTVKVSLHNIIPHVYNRYSKVLPLLKTVVAKVVHYFTIDYTSFSAE